MTKQPKVQIALYESADGYAVRFGTRTHDDVAGVDGLMEEVGGRLRVTEITFHALNAEKAEITSSTLRALRLDAVLSQARGQILESGARAQADEDQESLPPATAAEIRAWRRRIARTATAAAERKASGRRGWGDDFYRLVASEYVELTRQGKGGRGMLERLAVVMAERLNEPQPRPRDNIRDWVAEARKRQFLTPASPGRGGGGPGPRLYERGETS